MELDNQKIVITEIKAENAALKNEIKALREIIAQMPGNVYWKDRQGKLVGCNDNMAKILNVASTNILGKKDAEIYDPKLALRVVELDEEVMTHDETRIAREMGFNAEGKAAVYLSKKAPLHDEQGEVIGLFGISFDITDVIALLPGNVYWKDTAGKFLGCNDAVAKILNLVSRHDIVGKSNEELFDTELAKLADEIDRKVLASNQEINVEEQGLNSEGKPAVYLSKKAPLYNNEGQIIGLLGLSIDITERKKIEEALLEEKQKAEAANLAKSKFLSVVSHELRLPLTGILAIISFLKDGMVKPEDFEENLKMLNDCGQHLLSLVNDLLDFSKLESGKLVLKPVPMDLKVQLEEIASVVSAPAKSKGLDFWINYKSHVPHLLIADPRALRQILINLAGNAIKFTSHGYVAIQVDCLNQTESSAKLAISVQDTGKGIPADKQNVIFERFEQLQDTVTREKSRMGTGLGLSITKELVKLMDGEIKVSSEVGKGSTFSLIVEFPLQSNVPAELPWEPYAAKVTVLIINDSYRGAVLQNHLGSSMCQIAPSKHAINEIIVASQSNQPYQIIIIDQEISSAKPKDLLQVVQTQNSILQPMAVLLTSHSTSEDKQLAHKAGFFEIIAKPTSPIAFQTALATAWERWSEMQGLNKIREDLQSMRVLLVDDDLIIQYAHQKMLNNFTQLVEVADSGANALSKAKELFDIAFIDISLPDISGYKVIEMLRKLQNGKDIYIVALSAYTGETEQQACLAAGANEVATKPITRQRLEAILQRGKYKLFEAAKT